VQTADPPKRPVPSAVLFVLTLLALALTHLPRAHPADSPFVVTMTMKIVVSVIFGLASLIVIFSKRSTPKDKYWACATAGLVLGFWLR